VSVFTCQSGVRYERRDDMSPDGKLYVMQQPDGDMCIAIYGTGMISDEMRFASIEFTSPGAGGGRSPKVIQALRALAIAMQEDNADRPIAERPSESER
jgi:hypothetical protein